MTVVLKGNYIWGIPPYTFWMGIGVAISMLFFFYLLYENGIKIDKQLMIYIGGIVGVIVGARLFGCIKNLFLALYNHERVTIEIVTKAGLVYYGGLIGFLIGISVAICLIYQTFDFRLMNLIVITIPLFHSFGRIGCFFSGCCFGIKYTGILAVTYIGDLQEIKVCFPVQLIESFFEFGIFILLIMWHRKNKKINLLKAYLSLYAGLRFILEFARGDTVRGIFWDISFSQYVSLIIMIVLLCITMIQRKEKKYEIW